MTIFDKANGIELSTDDLQDAKTTAALFENEIVQKRAFANVIAARSALKFLFSLNIDATNLYSMYSINKVLENFDIADVYVGDTRIDARIVNDESEIFIPKSHFQMGILPDLYLVLKLEKDFSGVEFLGCINPEEIDKTKENKDYYFVDDDILYNLKIFKNLVKNEKNSKKYISTQDEITRAENLIIPFQDDDIFNADKEFFIQQLAYNIDLRKKTVEFENFEFVSKKVVTEETVYGDSILGLVGSEKLYDRGELSSDINLDELSDSTVDDFVESFKSQEPQTADGEEMSDEFEVEEILDKVDEENLEEKDLSSELNYDDIDLDSDLAIGDSESSKIELENILNEMISFTQDDESENVQNDSIIKDELEEELQLLSDGDDSDMQKAALEEDEDDGYEFKIIENDDEDSGIQDMENDNASSQIEEEEEEEDSVDFNDMSIDFESGVFELPEIGNFSFDEEEEPIDNEEDTDGSNTQEDEDGTEDGDELLNESKPQEPVKVDFQDDDEDIDLSDLPTLKIFQESPETYKKKMYKAPAIDDINLHDINLDDFDDYEKEDEEQETKDNEQFNEMMSNLDNILNNDSLPIESVAEILTDDDLSESLKDLENEQISASNISQEQFSDMEVSENSPTMQKQEQTSENGMSLDDFLNSSSFNEMSTNKNVDDNIEPNEIDNIYQDSVNKENLRQSRQGDEMANPEEFLTDEASMVDNSASFYNEDPVMETAKAKVKPKSSTPKLLAVLVVLLCVFAYTKKDDIMANFNFSAVKEEAPEFDLSKLQEPQPAPMDLDTGMENPIPTIPQPMDMPIDQAEPPMVASSPMPLNAPQVESDVNIGARPAPQSVSNKISKISWEVPETVASNPKIRKYLQIAGRTLKLSLQNDLLVATELPFSNRIMLDLKIAPSGNLIMTDYVISSGSKQIDNIVLQSVKDTLKYVRPPMGEIQSPNSNFTLIINF